MKKKNIAFLTVLVIFSVIGLKDIQTVQANTSTPMVLNDIILPPNPGSLADKTKLGVDVNNNNIRDDVEINIATKYGKDKKTFNVIMDFARKKQQFLMIALDDIKTIKEFNIWADSDLCLSKKMSINMSEATYINTELNYLVFNTLERQDHFQKVMLNSDQLNDYDKISICE